MINNLQLNEFNSNIVHLPKHTTGFMALYNHAEPTIYVDDDIKRKLIYRYTSTKMISEDGYVVGKSRMFIEDLGKEIYNDKFIIVYGILSNIFSCMKNNNKSHTLYIGSNFTILEI